MKSVPAVLSFAVLLVGLISSAPAQQDPLVVLSGDGFDAFGHRMAVAGDVDGDGIDDYIVAAPKADPAGDRSGQARVYSGADDSLIHVFDGSEPLHELGFAVDGAGDVNDDGYDDVILGEPWPYTVATQPGKAFVYSGLDGSLLLTLAGHTVLDRFGQAVAGLGDVDGDGHDDVAVSSELYIPHPIPPPAWVGRIEIFSGADGSELLEINGWSYNLDLGMSLAAAGDVDFDGVPDLLAGGPGWKGPNPFSVGAVFVLSGATGQVLLTGEAPPYSGVSTHVGDRAGMLGDVDGDGRADFFGAGSGLLVVWSGADGSRLHVIDCWTDSWDVPCAADLGDVDGDGKDDFVLGDGEGSALTGIGGLATVRSGADASVLMSLRGAAENAKKGTSVASLGDRDRDGLREFLLGAPVHGGFGPGQVHLHEVDVLLQHLSVAGTDAVSEGFGTILKGAGDVDNDGYPDVIAGEPYDDTVALDAGRATVFSGRDGSVLHVFLGAASPDRLGWSVDAAGDVDRDGYADVIVGAPFRQTPLAGAAFVYSGKTGAALLELEGGAYGDRFGTGVAGVGDVDGDGRPDLFVGAPYDDTGAADGGAAYLFSGADGSTLATLAGAASNLAFGHTVGGGGDVNADGTPDLLVWVPNLPGPPGTGFPGAVRVYSGSTGALIRTHFGEVNAAWFGSALDDARDVDGDGHDDVLVGAPNHAPGGGSPPGAAYVFSGATGALLFQHSVEDGDERIGTSVAGVGDLSGDGVPDVLVGVPHADILASRDGEMRLLSGVDGTLLEGYVNSEKDGKLGSAVDALGDLDFDGVTDVVAGAAKAAGQADGEFVIWVSGDGSSPWANLGGVLPGLTGAPALFPLGTLLPGEPVMLKLTGAKPLAPATLIAGLSELGAPFKGGTLVPQPTFLIGGLVTNGAGAITLSTTWPAGLPSGTAVHLQYWIVDVSGPAGLTASNGVSGTVP